MLTEILPGKTIEQNRELDYHLIEDLLGEELVKMRPKCSTLGLDTVKIAIQTVPAEKTSIGLEGNIRFM